FFEPSVYRGLLSRTQDAGIRMPIVPGLVPATNPRRLERLAAISGVAAPRELLHRLETASSSAERRRIGVRFTVDLARRVRAAGAPAPPLSIFASPADAPAALDPPALDRRSPTRQGGAR